MPRSNALAVGPELSPHTSHHPFVGRGPQQRPFPSHPAAVAEEFSASDADPQRLEGLVDYLIANLGGRGQGLALDGLTLVTWNLLRRARADRAVEQVHVMLLDVRDRLEQSGAPGAGRLTALADLLRLSLVAQRNRDPEAAARRLHAREFLDYLLRNQYARDGWCSRADVREHLQISEPSMTRLQDLLVDAGLVNERRSSNRLEFRLTREGRAQLRGLGPEPKAVEPPGLNIYREQVSIEARDGLNCYPERTGAAPPAKVMADV